MNVIEKRIASLAIPKYTHVPVEITINLASSPVLSYPWIMLDGLVMHLFIDSYAPGLFDGISTRDPVDVSSIPLPLKKIERDTGFIYRCSCSRFNGRQNTIRCFRKRVRAGDLDYLQTRKNRIDTVRGPFKAYNMRMVEYVATRCTFHANGDVDTLRSLLANLHGLGKKRAAGRGRVLSTTVKETSDDFSIVHPVHGLNRPLPLSLARSLGFPGENVMMLVNFPPYWNKQAMEPSMPPGGFT